MTPLVQFKQTPAYAAISWFYRDKKAERSGVPYIHHIDEGLVILEAIHAQLPTAMAYCLHPILQDDINLENAYESGSLERIALEEAIGWTAQHRSIHALPAFILAMEYRRSANSYLSRDNPEDLVMSPLNEVKQMLIADKVQNRKDFEMYHRQTHPRADALMEYFMNWMKILDVTEAEYERLCWLIEEDKKVRGVVGMA